MGEAKSLLPLLSARLFWVGKGHRQVPPTAAGLQRVSSQITAKESGQCCLLLWAYSGRAASQPTGDLWATSGQGAAA